MVEPNLIQNMLNGIVSQLKIIVGGVFGIYLLSFILKIYEVRVQNKILRDLRNDMNIIKKKLKIKDKKKNKKSKQ